MAQAAAITQGMGTLLEGAGIVYSTIAKRGDLKRAKSQMQDEKQYYRDLHAEQRRQIKGSQRAATAASGAQVDVGTAEDVIDVTRDELKRERDQVLKGYEYESDLLDRERDRALITGAAQLGGTLLKGVGTQTDTNKWNPFSSQGTSSYRPQIYGRGGR